MSKSNFSEESKRDAVRQITERGYPGVEVSQRLGVSPKAERNGSGASRPKIAINQHGLDTVPEAPQSGSFDEPTWQLPWLKLLQSVEARADTPRGLSLKRRSGSRRVRLYRDVLQPEAQAWQKRDAVARRVRKAAEMRR